MHSCNIVMQMYVSGIQITRLWSSKFAIVQNLILRCKILNLIKSVYALYTTFLAICLMQYLKDKTYKSNKCLISFVLLNALNFAHFFSYFFSCRILDLISNMRKMLLIVHAQFHSSKSHTQEGKSSIYLLTT